MLNLWQISLRKDIEKSYYEQSYDYDTYFFKVFNACFYVDNVGDFILLNSFCYKFLEIKNMMLSRRSKRNFSNNNVEEDIISEIIRISDFAPSAKNQHPQNWLIVHEPSKAIQVMELVVEWVKAN